MRIGTVIGKLELSRSAPGFEDVAWIQVRLEKETTVAADLVGTSPEQLVLLAEGEAAKRYRMDICADTIVAAVLAESGNNG